MTAGHPQSIAYLGPPGTYSEEALLAALGDTDRGALEFRPMETNRDVVLAVENDETEAAIVAIENSVEGAVTETLDALVHDAPDTLIVGELVFPVHHCLIAVADTELAAITTIASHPQALAQCARFINERLPNAKRAHASSTAEAVREAAAAGGGVAAIGSRIAADSYGAAVLRSAIEDVEGNKTRFVWIAKQPLADGWLGTAPDAAYKTSLVFAGFNDTSPGALVGILSEFAYRSVNLTKIESRPERTQLGHYLFFADLEGSVEERPIADAIAAIRTKVRTLRVLGSYPAHEAS